MEVEDVRDSQQLGLEKADSPEVRVLCSMCHLPTPSTSPLHPLRPVLLFTTERLVANLGEDTKDKVKGEGKY